MKKSWIVSLVCAILFSAFIGYMGKSFEKDDKPKVVVILKSLNTDYWKSMKAGADKAFADFKDKFLTERPFDIVRNFRNKVAA